TGVLSGKPITVGTPSFSVTVTDSASNTATTAFSMTISTGVSITTGSPLPVGYQLASYPATTFAATGGTGTGYSWTWAAASGSSLPAGLSLSTAGLISGAPTAAGTFSIVVTVTDSAQNTASATFSLTVEATLTITTTSPLKTGTASAPYSQQLAATGGTGAGTYTWSTNTAGTSSLTAVGLTLSPAGLVSGPSPSVGTASFTATVTDSASHTASAPFTLTISNLLTVTTATLPAATTGVAYSQTLSAAGGSGTYTWALSGTSNLATFNLTLNSAGLISGTPTPGTTGTASFTAKVTDSASNTATQALTIQVYNALTLPTPNPSTLGSATQGQPYTGSITATGGSGNYTWTVTGLTDNLTYSSSGATLTIGGTPNTVTVVSFNVSVQDNITLATAANTYTISVNSPPPLTLPTPNPTSLGPATVNQSYSGTISASGGVPPYTWSINGTTVTGSGLSLSNGTLSATSNGGNTLSISGAPSSTGTVTLTNVKIVDSESPAQSATNTYTIAVNPSGGSISGQVSLANNCGGNSNLPTFTVTAKPTSGSTQTTTTDSNGNYSFSSLPFGTYTITVSVSGASSTVSYPANYSVTLSSSNSSVSGENFNTEVGFNVIGTVSYSGSQTGQVYLYLQNTSCGGGQGNPGTSIKLTSGSGAYTIRGVTPGSYTVNAWMDSTGITSGTGYPGQQGTQNANDPTGSSTGFNVTAANATGIGVTLANPTYATPSNNPQLQVFPSDGGVLVFYNPPTVSAPNGNNEEAANEYVVNWAVSNGSDSDGKTCTLSGSGEFATVAGSHTFYAVGKGATVWILNNTSMGAGKFTAGTSYCFQAQSINTLASPTSPSGWATFTDNDGNAAATTVLGSAVFCSSGCTTVSGAITIPSSVTIKSGAPLYVGMYQQGS